MTKVGEIDLSGEDIEDKHIIFSDGKLRLQEEIRKLEKDKQEIWEAMMIDQGAEEHSELCRKLHDITKKIKEREEELNEVD